MRALLLLALLGLPPGAGQELASPAVSETDIALPSELLAALDTVRLRSEADGLESARQHLQSLLDGGALTRLLKNDDAVVRAGLAALELTTRELGMLELELQVKEARVLWLEARQPVDELELLAARRGCGAVLLNLGRNGEARAILEAAHERLTALVPDGHPELVSSQHALAGVLYVTGDIEQAHDLFQRVNEVWSRTLPADDPDLLRVRSNLGGVKAHIGDLEGALELLRAVHAVQEERLDPAHPDRLMVLENLGIVLYWLRDLEASLELGRELLDARRRSLPPEHPLLLDAELSVAATLYELGELDEAEELTTRVIEVRERINPRDHPDLVLARQNLACIRLDLGDFRGAHELFSEVHEVRAKTLTPEHPDLLQAKSNLAVTLSYLGEAQASLELDRYVHAARERTLPPDHPDLLQTKQNLAALLAEQGELEEALALEQHVLAILEEQLTPEHPDVLSIKTHLAVTQRELGNLSEALELEEAVLRGLRAALPDSHSQVLEAMRNLATTRLDSGDRAGSARLARSMLEGQLRALESALTEAPRVARAIAREHLVLLRGAIASSNYDSAEHTEDNDALLFSVLESSRALSTASSWTARAIVDHPELAGLRERIASSKRALNGLVSYSPEYESELNAWRDELVRRSEERDALERELRSSLLDRGVVVKTPSAERVAASLADDEVLVSYLRYFRDFARDPTTGEKARWIDSLLAFVLTPDGRVRRVDLGPCDAVESMLARWHEAMKRREGELRGVSVAAAGVSPGSGSAEVESGAALRRAILDPCLQSAGVEAPKRLIVVPDDILFLLPFDALPGYDGRRVADSIELRIEPSLQSLSSAGPPTWSEGTLVAVGDVDYGGTREGPASSRAATGDPDPSISRSGWFEPLSGTGPEVRSVGETFEAIFVREPVLLVQAEASRERLFATAPRARYLHIATHGWFESERFVPEAAGSIGGSENALSGLDRTGFVQHSFAPETLCGLALAGANRSRGELGSAPGLLTAEELATLDLLNCELAVLSACETNVGLRHSGQGTHSLQSALHAAGVRSAITSLWEVPDTATRHLMERFYFYLWREKLPKFQALWRAKQDLRATGVSVRDWAGWVLSGDPN